MIGENIKRYRKKKGLSQDKLCKLADVTHTTLAKIESGANDNPTLRTLKKIAAALEIKIDDIAGV
ncbi:MAG: helix-turn-helix transcriptional regulator [Candidatus Aureabacteria bacterium]|nr:helix-turn-helix transcriptional regulator [Candidatus Auribacterota bacterium]